MAAPKKKVAAPIDRPLSRAYLRNFTGWSTAYPPGMSNPASCRRMENVLVDRNGGMMLRPGLRYASYSETPGQNAGVWTGLDMVGTLEPFYLYDGSRAYLFAVRENTGKVTFRVLSFRDASNMVFAIDDPRIGLYCPQGSEWVSFTSATKYVSYVQIDNKIVAMSDAGEPVLLFFVGGEKLAKAAQPIMVPEWADEHKLTVVHPDADWIRKNIGNVRRNELRNCSFTRGEDRWHVDNKTNFDVLVGPGAKFGEKYMRLSGEPTRKNLIHAPLHDVKNDAYGIKGWSSGYGDPDLQRRDGWMFVYDEKGKGLFLADSKRFDGVRPGRKYRLAFDYELSAKTDVKVRVRFYRNNGAQIGDTLKLDPDDVAGRFESRVIEAPDDARSAMVRIGANSETKAASWVKVKNVIFCRENESLDFFSGDSTIPDAHVYWEDNKPNDAASIAWVPSEVKMWSSLVPIIPGEPVAASMFFYGDGWSANGPVPLNPTVTLTTFDKDDKELKSDSVTISTTLTSPGNLTPWALAEVVNSSANQAAVKARITVTCTLKALEMLHCDGGMIVSDRAVTQPFFTGATPSYTKQDGAFHVKVQYAWEQPDKPHLTASIETEVKYSEEDFLKFPKAQAPITDNTLVAAGGSSKNKFKLGMFYTFENEFGESAPSKVTEFRMSRSRNQWLWEEPAIASETTTEIKYGDPTGRETFNANSCCDQLAVQIPRAVYDNAVSFGAIRWNLYLFEWSDQDAVPVEARLVDYVEIYKDRTATLNKTPLSYDLGGWMSLTPNRKMFLELSPLPTKATRENYSKPSKSRNGFVAGDRIILVGDEDSKATVRWTSNRAGAYTNFTPTKGGGAKTLSSGNLYIPGAVVMWQNPQSVDTITVLCVGSDGSSTSYYMAPAEVTGQQSSVQVMGFEEVSNTPGSVAPYGALVHNNALFRPLDRGLLKTTAQNYNINHKILSDDIKNMWEDLIDKQWIMSCVHDNRLYFLVKNARGASMEPGCLGNEIWVYDMGAGEAGAWSRFLVQGSALKVIEYGPRVYVGVCRPDGFFYLDPEARLDDYVDADGKVGQRPIPWYFETNTQGANRAHDAWAHLQQVSVSFGNYYGAARYGIKSKSRLGKTIEMSKVFRDETPDLDNDGLAWDVEDHLLVRQDVKEWFFFAGSVEGLPGSGQINFVQYRYTPVSVNVGYEYGSVETFEYGRNAAQGADAYSANGVPLPFMDLEWQRTT